MRPTLDDLTAQLTGAIKAHRPTGRIVSDIADALPGAYDQLAGIDVSEFDPDWFLNLHGLGGDVERPLAETESVA